MKSLSDISLATREHTEVRYVELTPNNFHMNY